MLCIWILLAAFDQQSSFIHILFLGFFVLWSLPLSLLGIALLALFAFHVLRRRTLRLTVLTVIIALFAAGSIVTEAAGLHGRLSATIFPADGHFRQMVDDVSTAARQLVFGNLQRSRLTDGRIETLEPLTGASSLPSSQPAALAPRHSQASSTPSR